MDIVLGKVGAEVASKVTEGNKPVSGSSFQDMLTSLDAQADSPTDFSSLGIDNSDLTGLQQFNSIPADAVEVDPSKMNVGITSESSGDKLVDMLSEVNKSQMHMDNLLNDVLYGGRKFSNQELLVIQAQIHHFSEMTELTVKVAEQSVSATKQVLSTQA